MPQTIKEIPATETAEFVRIEDGKEFHCSLPIGPNVNNGTGHLFWINKGFVPKAEFASKKHAAEAEARRLEAEEAKAAEKKVK